MRRKRLIVSIVLLLVVLVCFRIIRDRRSKKNVEELTEERATWVKTTVVQRGNIEETLFLNGDVHGLREVDVYTRVSGKLVKKIKEEGDIVKKDEVVALVDRDQPALGFARAEVRSPIDGIILKYYVDIGDSVIPQEPMPQEPVFNVAYVDVAKVVVNVSEKDIGKIKKGSRVYVSVPAYPGEKFLGKVAKISPSLDTRARKLQVEIEMDNRDHRLLPGMFADVEIIYKEHKNILLLPKDAIVEREGRNVVFVVENGYARLREVKIGATTEEMVEVVEGVNEGEQVVTEGNFGLRDGTKVEIEGT